VQTQGVADIIEIELRNMNAISGELNQCQNRRAHLDPDFKLTSSIKELVRVWRNTTEQNMYLTGGIGPSAHNEGFTVDYDLPSLTAYQETCATVALAQWSHRLAMYAGDYQKYPGCLWVGDPFYYVWPPRILSNMGDNRKAFWCPAANLDSSWDTNFNNSLGATGPTGVFDRFGVSHTICFSYGYNDWGLQDYSSPLPQLGMGGDVNVVGEINDNRVRNPSDMIVITDSKSDGSFDGNIDPKESDQWPCNRHQGRTVLNYADGHSEAARRKDVNDPENDTWRRRWNNDNLPHPEMTWTVDAVLEAKLDP